MPFTRISLRAGKSQEYLRAIVDGLDRALVETFDVPENDQFVAIHQHLPEELVFDRQYGGGPRSDDFVLFHVATGRTRTNSMKDAFYKRLTDRLSERPGIRPEDVMVVLINSTMDDFSFSSGVSATADERARG